MAIGKAEPRVLFFFKISLKKLSFIICCSTFFLVRKLQSLHRKSLTAHDNRSMHPAQKHIRMTFSIEGLLVAEVVAAHQRGSFDWDYT